MTAMIRVATPQDAAAMLAIYAPIGSDAKRLRDIFRCSGVTHEAWGTMIVEVTSKGSFKLAQK